MNPGEFGGLTAARAELQKRMAKFSSRKQVYVGLPAGSGTSADGTSIVEYGTYNEFGTANIPERSFLRVPLRQNSDKIRSDFTRLMKLVAEDKYTLDQALNQIGAKAASISQEAISAGIAPENAPSTIAKKGQGKNTLVDTGRMRQAITWVVRDKDQ